MADLTVRYVVAKGCHHRWSSVVALRSLEVGNCSSSALTGLEPWIELIHVTLFLFLSSTWTHIANLVDDKTTVANINGSIQS